jgi:hypothetical protein
MSRFNEALDTFAVMQQRFPGNFDCQKALDEALEKIELSQTEEAASHRRRRA